jgi:amidase
MKTITETARSLGAGEVSCEDIARGVLENVRVWNPSVNALVTTDEREFLDRAIAIDEADAHGKGGSPLFGIPFTVKDNYETAGMRTTAGHQPFASNIPEKDAVIVKRMRNEGALLLGKTNLAELALDAQTNNPLFGRTSNPYDLSRTSGGSSGGGAAAVATGMSFADLGNDLLGSIRIPASYCGVCAFVPTAKTVPVVGMIPRGSRGGTLARMIRPGFITRSPEDLAHVLDAVKGPCPEDPEITEIKAASGKRSGALKIGVLLDWHITVSKEILETVERLGSRLEELGNSVGTVRGFKTNRADPVLLRVLYSSLGATLPPPIRIIMKTLGKNRYLDMDLKSYLKAEDERISCIEELEALFADFDALIAPVSSTVAFPHLKPSRSFGAQRIYTQGIDVDGRSVSYAAATVGLAVPFSVTGNPVAVIPAGLTERGLPVGVQIVGKRFGDEGLLEITRTIAEAAGKIPEPENPTD